MNTPFARLLETQMSMVELSTETFSRAVEFWANLADRQMHVFGGLGEAEHRSRAMVPQDASFVGHYGKRAHDIDPEHDV